MKDVREIVERLRPTVGRQAEALWALYLASDRNEQRELETTLRLLDLKHNATAPGNGPPGLPPPEPGVLDGWLRLGEVRYPSAPPAAFGLQPGELIQHVGIFGRSGAGKTNTVLVLLRELLRKDIPFLIFDWKRNYRDLLAAPWVPKGKVAAFTAGRDLAPIRLNPLRPPPGTEPRIWLKKIIEIMAHAYFLGEGVMYLMQEAIDRCYEKAGVYEGSDRYPTFHDVHDYLKHRKVSGLTFGHMADTVCAEHPNDIAGLLKGSVVLELDALTDTDKIFLVEALMLHIHHLRLADPDRETLKHVLVVEEAHHVFLKAKQEIAGGEPITDVILREIRELGEAVVLVDQHPSQIAITALGNTFCTIAMNLKHRFDVTTVSDACLLYPEQKEHLGRLPVGQAVVKLQDRWPSPFMVSFPRIEISKGAVTDVALRERMEKRPNLRPTAKSREPRLPMAPMREVSAVPETPKEQCPDLRPEELCFLDHVARHPTVGVTQRYVDLGLSRRKGTKMKRTLVKIGLIREVNVALPGGRITLLDLTPQGWPLVDTGGPSNRFGGPIHRYWVEKAARSLEREGYSIEEEAPVGEGRTLDLCGMRNGERVVVEIEASARRLKSSIDKLVETQAERRLLVCCDRTTVDKARALCAENPSGEDIEIRHAWSLIRRSEKPGR
jgi:hypothetical protein